MNLFLKRSESRSQMVDGAEHGKIENISVFDKTKKERMREKESEPAICSQFAEIGQKY